MTKYDGWLFAGVSIVIVLEVLRAFTWGKQPAIANHPISIGMSPYVSVTRRG